LLVQLKTFSVYTLMIPKLNDVGIEDSCGHMSMENRLLLYLTIEISAALPHPESFSMELSSARIL